MDEFGHAVTSKSWLWEVVGGDTEAEIGFDFFTQYKDDVPEAPPH